MHALPPPLNNWSSCPYFITPIPHKPSGTLHYHKSDLLNRSIKQIFPSGSVVRIHLQCRRHGFDPWVRKIPWRRKQQPTPVFLPGISHGQRSLAGYSPRGCKRVGHKWVTKQQQQTTKQIICIMGSMLTPYPAWYSNNLVPFTYPVSYPTVHSGLCMRAHTHTCMHASTDLIPQLGSLNVSILGLSLNSQVLPETQHLQARTWPFQSFSRAPSIRRNPPIPHHRCAMWFSDSPHHSLQFILVIYVFRSSQMTVCSTKTDSLTRSPCYQFSLPGMEQVFNKCQLHLIFSSWENVKNHRGFLMAETHQTSAVSRSRWKSA